MRGGARAIVGTALLAIACILWRDAAPGQALDPVDRPEGLPAGAIWAVDPRDPGPNLPPAGRSLFDFLTTHEEGNARVQRVPFPFSALLAEIDERLGRRPGEPSPLKRVLIPLGRSLQRNAAEPEFFRYPRVVVAVDTEAAPESEMFLKDRLYLGYHEKAAILEVISYNEAAGRFEFQIVRDYGPRGAAQVIYANRAVCTACHQGGGPLFSRPLWLETNANKEIARLLAAEGRDFYGVPAAPGVEVPSAIDAATDRANRIAVYQLLWREGCGGGESAGAIHCRAAAFTAALQRRLSGGLFHDTAGEAFREDFLRTARRAWQERWPRGLAVPDPDIPNRDPLAAPKRAPVAAASLPATLGSTEARRLGEVVLRSHVPAFFEPLNPRPPLEVWTADGGEEKGPERLVTGLAELLADEDVRQLDAALFARGSRPGAPRERTTLPCEVATQPWEGNGERVKLRCAALEGRIYLDGPRVTGGTIDRLENARDLDVTGGGSVTRSDGQREVEIAVAQQISGLHVRRPGGGAVELVRLTWKAGAASEATVVFLDDFAPAAAAVQQLAAKTASGALDVFSSRPFRRTAVMGALFTELGLKPAACCLDDAGMPPPYVETAGAAGPADFPEPAVQALYRYCARCHATSEVSPPNFLYGDTEKVRANLTHCAERIFYRLDVWRLPAGERPKTPMPPIHALPALGLEADRWPNDPDLGLLRQYASSLLRASTGTAPRLEEMEARGYESLKSCLPPAEAAR